MTKFRAFSLPVCLLVMCCISTLVNSIPQQWTRQRRQDKAATSTTSTTTSSTTTTTPSTVVAPINPKVRSKKLSSLIKNGNSTAIKNVNIKLENVNITAMLDMDKIELTPEFLENTMNDYMELSKAVNDDAPNEAFRERRTAAVFQRLRSGAQSGISLLRSLSPRLAAVLPASLPGGASSSSSDSDSDSDSDSGSDSSSGGSSQSIGARFLAFVRRLLTTMFNFITSAFRRVRSFFSSGGAGAGLVSGIRMRVSGLLGRGTTTEAPDYDLGGSADTDDASSGSDSGSDSSEAGVGFSSSASPEIDVRDNDVNDVTPDFKPMPSFDDSASSSGSGASAVASSGSSSGYSDSSMSSSSATGGSGYPSSSTSPSSSSSSSGGYSGGGSSGSGGYSSSYSAAPSTYVSSYPSYFRSSPYVVQSPSFYSYVNAAPLVY